MPNFAILKNNVVINIVVSEPEFADAQGWVPIPDDMSIGCVFDGAVWTNLNASTPEELLETKTTRLREKRNNLLLNSDWTQMPDYNGADKAAWATYRQALRDIPQQPGFPTEVTWPVQPE